MRKVIYLCVAVVSLALFSGQAYAQRYLPGMMGVELRGGFAGGSKGPLNYYTGFAVSGYTKKANRWVAGAEYLLKNYEYRTISVPRAQFTAEGYETVNWGDRMMHDGSRLLAGDAFLYGGALTLELETYITDRIVLLANVRERALWGSPLGVFTTQFGLGVKIIIN